MRKHLRLQSAKSEAQSALARHLKILSDVQDHSITRNTEKDQFLYLMAIPVIYAAWEGFFRISCSICLRRKCYVGKKSKNYDAIYSTLWLQKEAFVSSFLTSLVNGMQLGRAQKKIGQGQFNAISKFSENLAEWHERPLNHLADFDKLVMTHSNVNREVTELNADIIGIDLSTIDFSRIDELVNRRNEIAHGGMVNYPTETTIVELLQYTQILIGAFHACVGTWLDAS
jgi:hypothetical protein